LFLLYFFLTGEIIGGFIARRTMRKDMKDLLVNTGRRAEYGESRRFRFKHTDPDVLPSRLSRYEFLNDTRSQGDRLRPLYRFLETNCGRLWADVYAEICKVSDHRTIRGFHLRQHVEQYVQSNNYDIGHRRSYGPFFVDLDGTLQKERELTPAERHANFLLNAKRYKWKPEPQKIPNPRVPDTADRWWEKIEGYWYEFTAIHTKSLYSEEFLIDRGNNVVEIGRTPQRVIVHHETRKRQVDSKMSKKLEETLRKKAA
jgi:hypothetical protein